MRCFASRDEAPLPKGQDDVHLRVMTLRGSSDNKQPELSRIIDQHWLHTKYKNCVQCVLLVEFRPCVRTTGNAFDEACLTEPEKRTAGAVLCSRRGAIREGAIDCRIPSVGWVYLTFRCNQSDCSNRCVTVLWHNASTEHSVRVQRRHADIW
jgi:hypothetical protein